MESENHMKQADFDSFAAHAADSVFTFAEFAKRTEQLFADSESAEALEPYRSAWFELEIVNATALDEWESDGRPGKWNEKWNEKYKNDAIETVNLIRDAALRLYG